MQLKINKWQRFVRFISNHQGVMIAIVIGMVVTAGSLLACVIWYLPQLKTVAAPLINVKKTALEAPHTVLRSPLTGAEVPNEGFLKKQVTAIMIENSLDARPQSGLKEAGVVYEAIAEGGITRFAAIYQESRPGLVGPVRSLRPYYLSWMAPYDASIVHVGGSKNALDEARSGRYKDSDQFFNGKFFWRATDRVAPHNVYTSFDKLDEMNASKGFTASTFSGFTRKLDSPAATPNASIINVTISSPVFNSSYNYDQTTNTYHRSVGGAPHNDREAGRITPKSVVVLKVASSLGFEDGYREQMAVHGTGEAFIFQDGTVHKALWHKKDQKSPLQLYDITGKPIALNTGQTWITAISPAKSVTWQ